MSLAPAETAGDLEFTGERFLPGEPGIIHLEHLHRYGMVRELVANRAVLDIACGEGYGAALMAERAASVIGVDIDPATVAHAAQRYEDKGIRFLVGSCAAIPAPDASVDIVTSFETIEHHDQHEAMMREIKRVLRPGGLLVLSSPNRKVYTEESGYNNPFHVKELDRAELETLLASHFGHVRLFGQLSQLGSFIFPLANSADAVADLLVDAPDEPVSRDTRDQSVLYYIALCSEDASVVADAARISTLRSAYFSPTDKTFQGLQAAYQEAVTELRRHQEYLPQLEQSYRDLEQHRNSLENDLRSVLEREAALRERLQEIESRPEFRLTSAVRHRLGSGRTRPSQ